MSKPINPEVVDLSHLVEQLRGAVFMPIEGDIAGRTLLRDATVRLLDCSQLEAEQLVDTMVSRGFLRCEPWDDGRRVWRLLSR